jgi:hypothetical protein
MQNVLLANSDGPLFWQESLWRNNMKHILSLAFLFAISSAFAADHIATITVSKKDRVLFTQTTTFVGLTDAESSDLVKSGINQLEYAAKHQDKGGDYKIIWQWNKEPAVETSGMRSGPVHSTLRQGAKWLDVQINKSEVKNK